MSAAMITTNPFDDDKLHEECGVFGIYRPRRRGGA